MSTDPRIAIVAEYLKAEGFESSEAGNYDGSLEHTAEGILSKLDAIPSPSGEELVERVSDAVSDAILDAFSEGLIGDVNGEAFVEGVAADRIARAALSAIPPSGALGLARDLLMKLSERHDLRHALDVQLDEAESRCRALVAMLERREA